MSDTTQPPPSPGLYFNIGKSYGMAGKREEMEKHRVRLQQLTVEVLQQQKRVFEEYTQQISAISTALKKLEETRTDFSLKMPEKATDLIRVLKANLDNAEKDDPRLKEKAGQLYKKMEDAFMRDWELTSGSDSKLKDYIASLQENFRPPQDRMKTAEEEFERKLNAAYTDLTEMERGYCYGDALRIQLNGKK